MEIKHCQCEHEAHFDKTKHTPNGNFGHIYEQIFMTDNKSFTFCQDCEKDCQNV